MHIYKQTLVFVYNCSCSVVRPIIPPSRGGDSGSNPGRSVIQLKIVYENVLGKGKVNSFIYLYSIVENSCSIIVAMVIFLIVFLFFISFLSI